MLMNPTSQNPGSKFPFSSGHNAMDNRTLYLTLAVSTVLGFLFTLVLYASVFGRNPFNRLGYGIFVSVLPALGAFVVLKLTRLLVSWRGAVFIYVVLFALVVIIQALGRMIPVYR
jgi:hypothetical protein